MSLSAVAALNFTEDHQGNVILEKLRSQKENGRFCDVVFHLKDRLYPAHRNVLAASSPYFDSMLKVNKVAKEHMTVICSKHQVFESFLEYVYTGKIVVDSSTFVDLAQLSSRFMMTKLSAYCCEYMERNLAVNNCFMIRDLAEKCSFSTLVKTADAFILANLLQVWQKEEVLEFSDAKLEGVISDKSLPVIEDYKIHLLCRWTKHSVKERERKFGSFLSLINWSAIMVPSLYTLLRQDTLFAQSEWCLYHMLQTMEEKGHLFAGYTDTLRLLREKLIPQEPQQLVPIGTIEPLVSISGATCHSSNLELDEGLASAVIKMEMQKAESPRNLSTSDPLPVSSLQNQSQQNVHDSGEEDITLGSIASDSDAVAASLTLSQDSLLSESIQMQQSVSDPSPVKGKRNKRKGIPTKVSSSKSQLKILDILLSKVKKKPGRPKKTLGDVHSNNGTRKKSTDNKPHTDNKSDKNISALSKGTSDIRLTVPKRKKKNLNKKRRRAALSCPTCPYTTVKGEERLASHMRKNHAEDTTFQCSECDYTSKWNREFNRHLRTHFPGPPYNCDSEGCAYSVDRLNVLMLHRMKHSNERPFECTVCNSKFRTQQGLNVHMKCHTGEKPYPCPVCNRCFATKGTLDQHSVTHSDIRPYLCDLCGFSTKYQSHLIAHMRIHKGDVFKCQFPNCKYTTPKRCQLACHMRSHMSIRSHICSVCGRGFIEKSHLVRHEKIHLDDKPFKCYMCDYSSTRRDKLKEHMEKYHNSESASPPKTPYKPRKARRQSFDPHLYPGITQAQAQAQMQHMIQLAEQNKPSRKQAQLAIESIQVPSIPISDTVSEQQPNSQTTGYSFQSDPASVTTTSLATDITNQEQIGLVPASAQTIDSQTLGLIIDPRVQSLVTSQAVTLLQPASALEQVTAYNTQQPQNSAVLNQSQIQQPQEYTNLNTFMNIF